VINGAFAHYEHLKETLASYLETAYKVGHPLVAAERAALLSQDGVITRVPFLETTPRFVQGKFLRDLDGMFLPDDLAGLAACGLTTDRYPLYAHQQEALLAAWDDNGDAGNFVVASGTGSGKTECFYLPVLADLLTEVANWTAPTGPLGPGRWQGDQWVSSRHEETRPAAVRALILYPTNALVNDQLRRLRMLFDSSDAAAWQEKHLGYAGTDLRNRFFFGRYTSHTSVAGSPSERKRRRRWEEADAAYRADWGVITEDNELRNSGGWPRPSNSEMLNRWDMQARPPDILITNYSMLEYMLVRPIEAPIFAQTREWLRDPAHRFTLVVDEAHTYSGARGTEVAYLLRRLQERLDVKPQQLRCIATSASLGDDPAELARARELMGDLFGQPGASFRIITAQRQTDPVPDTPPSAGVAEAFAAFNRTADLVTEQAVETLLKDLGESGTGDDPSTRLYDGLKHQPQLSHIRSLTAGRATPLAEVARKVFGGVPADRAFEAVAGALSAGAFARPHSADQDAPPLLPSRIHFMFRGLPGLWACADPRCQAVEPGFRGGRLQSRPLGKLYASPRIWCECGARVLEVLSCRVCGHLWLGGVHDENDGRDGLWPYDENLDGGFQDYDQYGIFAAEAPHDSDPPDGYFEIDSGLFTNFPGSRVRPVWRATLPTGNGRDRRLQRPTSCPRCHRRGGRREVVEDLRTSGQAAFTVVTEDAFRLQTAPRRPHETTATPAKGWFPVEAAAVEDPDPNLGRKILTFSDSRQDAAILAGDLEINHARDLRRQVLLKIVDDAAGLVPFTELKTRMYDELVLRGIDPSFGQTEGFFRYRAANGAAHAKDVVSHEIDAYLRTEISSRDIAVEPLGLGRWIPLAEERPDPHAFYAGHLDSSPGLPGQAWADLLFAAVRILGEMGALLPSGPSNDQRDFPLGIVSHFDHATVSRDRKGDSIISWAPERTHRLVRYLKRVADAVDDLDLATILDVLWAALGPGGAAILQPSSRGDGLAIKLDRLGLAPPVDPVLRCGTCGYLINHTVAGVCLRCEHAEAQPVPLQQARSSVAGSYYRRIVGFVGGELPDPFPLRVEEHTAQISVRKASLRERYFRDQFIRYGDSPETPLDLRVDGLSVTTTMEMGIDIGDLNSVGLRNVPPTVANYQQRAGRAGRRSSQVAVVYTQARDRSHDRFFFQHPEEMISGRVRLPRIYLDNQVIAHRHLNALILQTYFAGAPEDPGLFEAFGSVGDFIEGDGRTRLAETLFEPDFRKPVTSAAERILPVLMHHEIDSWIEQLPSLIDGALNHADAGAGLLEVLIANGLLPRYAFPIDLVAYWVRRPERGTFGDEIQRGTDIALSEFAPGASIIVDKMEFKSAALYEPYERHPNYAPDRWFFRCGQCQATEGGHGEAPQYTTCPECHVPLGDFDRPREAIEPSGFATDWSLSPKRYTGGGRERAGFSSRASLEPGQYAAVEGAAFLNGRVRASSRTGDLQVANRGTNNNPQPGFLICVVCGRVEESAQAHKRPTDTGTALAGNPCPGDDAKFQRAILSHHFRSDVATIAVLVPPEWNVSINDKGPGRAAWLSVAQAIGAAAAIHLQIDPGELAANIRPWRTADDLIRAEVFLYDTIPNGAGYAREAVENLESILVLAHKLTSECAGFCETACYECLLDYGNQLSHAYLDRHLAADMLRYALTGVTPDITDGRRHAALEAFLKLSTTNLGIERDVSVRDITVPARITTPDGTTKHLFVAHSLTGEADRIEVDFQVATGQRANALLEFELLHRPMRAWRNLMHPR